MASLSAIFPIIFFFSIFFTSPSPTLSASVVEDLNTLLPPPDFNATIAKNCLQNPSHRYCNSSPTDLNEIFKSTIVASHLCNESRNPNCVTSFPKIDLRGRPNIAPLYLSFSFFWKYCPLSIISIDFSNSSMKGSFPIDVLQCTQIEFLDLSYNELSGDVPIQEFAPLSNLTLLNLSYNQFSETRISDSQFFNRFNSSCFVHSGLLPSHKNFRIKAVILLVGFPISVILTTVFLGWLCLRRPDVLPRILQRKYIFTPSMLNAATDRFSRKNLLGKSEGFGIYRGVLRDETEVRIEVYWDKITREKNRKFVKESKVLVQLRHKNLVRVLGWCNSRKMRAVVEEWREGETVETWLSAAAPPWKQRLKVLMGVVEGMCYLEEQWPEVGYDLKTNSVMLSSDRKPLISRFKIGDHNSSSRKICKFGVFLLEMITNRRPREEFENGEAGFVEFIRMHYPKNLEKVIDERMEVTDSIFDQAKQGIGLGLMCTNQSGHQQPSLGQISDMISRVYESCTVLASHTHRRSHGDGSKGHKRIQSR